ncbi:ParB/RepB/Spo0J family partition protein [Treponema porcinum]|uniref:ParB-like nuclease domain-containing protein n=1 Tax=Treponema porcinum TaxID=261392 RepID=A0A1T4JKH9_TREPO|nr:ParB/RepB/Spo0J family partition protein [Treponema porcinum]SJZ30695.1 ParB-like nuclease domain-containing protein [Treponema porcinum]
MAKLVTNTNTALMGTGMNVLAKLVPVSEIKTIPELSEIFTKQDKVVEDIEKSMNKNGFQNEEPIVIAKLPNGTILGVADGNTRLMVAKKIGLDEVPVVYKTFGSLEDAIQYAKDRQFHRRNLSQAEIYNYANNLDSINMEDRNGEGRATERLAEELGISASTIEHARTVENRADEETKEKIKNNELSINQAYQKVRKSKKKSDENLDSDNSASDDFDDISDALEDNEGNPGALSFITEHPREDVHKLTPEEDVARTNERKNAYEIGLKKGSDLAYEIYVYILSLIDEGKSADEIRDDEKLSDFSKEIIYEKFEIDY